MTDLLDRLVEARGGTKVYVLAAIEYGGRPGSYSTTSSRLGRRVMSPGAASRT